MQTHSMHICTNNNIYSPATITEVFVMQLFFLCVAAVTGIFAGGIWKNAIPHFTPLLSPSLPPSCTYSILLHHFSALALLLLTNKCSQVVWSYCLFLCPTSLPLLPAPPAMFNYSGASCAPVLSQFTGKASTIWHVSTLDPTGCTHRGSRRETGCVASVKFATCIIFNEI